MMLTSLKYNNEMNILELLKKAKESKIDVYVEGEKLFVKTAKDQVIDKSILADIKLQKGEILSFLMNAKMLNQDSKVLIPKIDRSAEMKYPLSFSQERLWFIDKLQGSTNYHISNILKLEGKLDVEILEESLRTIIQRHEVFRTVFSEENGEVSQVVKSEDEWKLNFEEDNQSSNFYDLLSLKFDLEKDYMFRATLTANSESSFILTIIIHHIAFDAWSMNILIKELVELYSSKYEKRKPQLDDVSIQFIDFACWQKDYLKDEVLAFKLNYWKNKLEGWKPVDLPIDFSRPAIMSSVGKTKGYNLGDHLQSQLRELSQEEETTSFISLFALFNILISKYANQDDLCVGIPIANRTEQQTASSIGFFVNSLAIRSDFSQNLNFSEYLKELKKTMLDAYTHQDVPFEKVIESIETNRDLSRSPIFQVMFSFQAEEKAEEISIPDLKITQEDFENKTSKYDLIFNVSESNDGLSLVLQYNTELYKETTIDRMVEHYTILLEQILADRKCLIDDLEMINESEKVFLNENGVQEVNYENDKSVLDLFEEQALKSPDNIAVSFNDKQLTYKEVNEKANKLAHYVIETYNIEEGDVIGILTNRSDWYLISILAVLKAGGIYLPIDAEYPVDRKRFILEDSKVKAIIIESEILYQFMELGISVFSVDIMFDTIKTSSSNIARPNFSLDNVAYLIYTSGSTGTPKGVMVTFRNLLNLCNWHCDVYEVNQESRATLFAGIAFDASVWEIFPYLTTGACIFPLNDNNIRFDTQELHKFILEKEISHIYLPTQVCLEFVNAEYELPSTKILTGGESLFLPKKTNLNIYNNYGPTENTVVTTFHQVTKESIGAIPIGKPIANNHVYVLNKNMQQVPRGIYGELFITGKNVAQGYLNQPKLTSEKFIENPFQKGKLYATGDLVRWNESGLLEFKERLDSQVKIRGFRIELGEIEMVLNKNEKIKNSIVLVNEKDLKNKKLIAFILPDGDLDMKELRNYLLNKLSNYMIPTQIIIIDDVPITNNGKVDKEELLQLASEHKPTDHLYVAPKNQSEKKIQEIWEGILGISEIGVNDDFFELGGHSLLATKVMSKVKLAFDINISVRDIFNYSTISELSYMLENYETIEEKLFQSIDLEKETQFDIDFSQMSTLEPYKVVPEKIFLTGATGFIGTYLLNELLVTTDATVYCLTRGEGDTKSTLIKSLEYYHLYDSKFEDRIVPVLGDLSQPHLGISEPLYSELASEIDYIFHSATYMDHFSSYDKMKVTNVDGNVEIVNFSLLSKKKKIIYMSTPTRYLDKSVITEEESRDFEEYTYASGYDGSKWVGEKIMSIAMEAGVDMQIHRLGLVTGDLKSGRMPKAQWFPKVLKSCYELGMYTPEFLIPLIPIDFVSKAVIGLAFKENIVDGYFHIQNGHLISLKNMFEENNTTGRNIERVTMQEILIALLENSDKKYLPIMPFVDFKNYEILNAMEGLHPVREDNTPTAHSNKKTLNILKEELDLDFPDVREYFSKYLKNAINEY
jgi:amino acid adenylation domain-containing protein/thioester reductase-like protein